MRALAASGLCILLLLVTLGAELSAVEAPVAVSPRGRTAAPNQREPYHSPTGAALRSLVVPGWGQHYVQQPERGLGYLGAAGLGLLFAFEIISFGDTDNSRRALRAAGIAEYGFVAVLSAYDAATTADELNVENGYELGRLEPEPRLRLTLFSTRF